MLTDELLEQWKARAADEGGLNANKCLDLIETLQATRAELRRLRELERACDVLWCERRQDGTRCMASPIIRYSKEETQRLDAAIATIGRLLEGEG